jgi:hypothetical protein
MRRQRYSAAPRRRRSRPCSKPAALLHCFVDAPRRHQGAAPTGFYVFHDAAPKYFAPLVVRNAASWESCSRLLPLPYRNISAPTEACVSIVSTCLLVFDAFLPKSRDHFLSLNPRYFPRHKTKGKKTRMKTSSTFSDIVVRRRQRILVLHH